MKPWLVWAGGASLAAAAVAGTFSYIRGQQNRAIQDSAALQRLDNDVQAAITLGTLKANARSGLVILRNVILIDAAQERTIPGQTVIVRGEKIAWLGPNAQAPQLDGGTEIDGAGHYLSPGLVDMHVHTEGLAQHVLRLAAGVTSVRDMDGMPWLLRMRDAIAAGRMIGATPYVAGTIIADQPLDGYAVVAKSVDDARQIVRNQSRCGYAFIKIHNSLAQPLLDAVADEARRNGLDLVGHVPHDISLQHAIQVDHMRTVEHLKGFFSDRDFAPSTESFAAALAGAKVWVTPTLYTRRQFAYGDEARSLLTGPRSRYVPQYQRLQNSRDIAEPGSDRAKTYDRYVASQTAVMSRLVPLNVHWLVGTDAAGYAFNVAGFATLDELQLLRAAGLSNGGIIRAATSEAATAMRKPDEFGRIAIGMRADFILLATDPLRNILAYNENLGVMARGRWFDRKSLDAALAGIAHQYDSHREDSITPSAATGLAQDIWALAKAGFVLEDSALDAGAVALEHNHAPGAARRLRSLISAPRSGVCAADLPN